MVRRGRRSRAVFFHGVRRSQGEGSGVFQLKRHYCIRSAFECWGQLSYGNEREKEETRGRMTD